MDWNQPLVIPNTSLFVPPWKPLLKVKLNPGTESAEVLVAAEGLGLNVIQACSIVGIGMEPEGM